MKTLITILMCALVVILPIQQVNAVPKDTPPVKPDHAVFAICVIGVAAVAGIATYFIIKSCKPKYYCVVDEDGNVFSSNASKHERAINGWKVKSGPYSTPEAANAACPPPKTNAAFVPNTTLTGTNGVTNLTWQNLQNPGDEIYIPEASIIIWRSTDGVNYVPYDTIVDDPSSFTWNDPEPIGTNAMRFYKVSL